MMILIFALSYADLASYGLHPMDKRSVNILSEGISRRF